MTGLEAATLYVGLFAFLFAGLKMNCGRVRAGQKIDVGDGSNEAMIRAMRTQGNAVEDVPVPLIGLFGLAVLDAPLALIHGFGAVFFTARLLHALGMGGAPGFGMGRLIGTVGSLLSILGIGGSCLWLALT